MKNKTQIAFNGLVGKALCSCHQGKWIAFAFLAHPVDGNIKLAHTFFDTESEAETHLDSFVTSVAQTYLKKIGLSIEDATHVTVKHGDAAAEASNRFMNENNPNLH